VSLGTAARMRFRPYPPRKGDTILALELQPRSAYLLQDDVRWKWQPQRAADAGAALFDHLSHAGGAMSALPKALLFDLGGVVMALDWDRVFSHWAEHSGVDSSEIRRRYAFDPPYERHERGEIGERDYYAALRDSLGIEIGDEALAEGWGRVFAGEITPTVRLIEQVKDRVPVYAFSNTNTAHERVWSRQFAAALAHFRKVFVSSRMGATQARARRLRAHRRGDRRRARRHPLLRRHDRERRGCARRGPSRGPRERAAGRTRRPAALAGVGPGSDPGLTPVCPYLYWSAPALATWPSWSDMTPETPIAPTILPSM